MLLTNIIKWRNIATLSYFKLMWAAFLVAYWFCPCVLKIFGSKLNLWDWFDMRQLSISPVSVNMMICSNMIHGLYGTDTTAYISMTQNILRFEILFVDCLLVLVCVDTCDTWGESLILMACKMSELGLINWLLTRTLPCLLSTQLMFYAVKINIIYN